jgi:hypothetical protein
MSIADVIAARDVLSSWIRSRRGERLADGHVPAARLLQVDVWRIGQREQGLLGHHETLCYPFLMPNCR